MVSTNEKKLHAVETDRGELEKKLKAHRRRIVISSSLVLLLLVIAGIVTYIYYANKSYTDFETVTTLEREDTGASDFASFQGKLLKCTNDGAVYTDLDGTLIWNQTYEMDEPRLEMCGDYVVVYEQSGTQVYILDTVNLQGSIHTTMPIQEVSIASQGTVAVLMENDGTSYLQLYDKSGTQLAAGELHVQNSGYPLDIALSENGEKLAVSMLDINEGSVKTVIAFYNFGTVGQNAIDKIVSSYTYSELVIPQLRYLSGDTLVAFGDDRVILFTGSQKPAESKTIELSSEVKGIFYNEKHFGLIYDGDGEKKHRLEYYNLSGDVTREISFDMDYSDVSVLDNGNICIMGEDSCEIYNRRGLCKFQYTFGKSLYQVFSGRFQSDYTLILEGETQKVKLK